MLGDAAGPFLVEQVQGGLQHGRVAGQQQVGPGDHGAARAELVAVKLAEFARHQLLLDLLPGQFLFDNADAQLDELPQQGLVLALHDQEQGGAVWTRAAKTTPLPVKRRADRSRSTPSFFSKKSFSCSRPAIIGRVEEVADAFDLEPILQGFMLIQRLDDSARADRFSEQVRLGRHHLKRPGLFLGGLFLGREGRQRQQQSATGQRKGPRPISRR